MTYAPQRAKGFKLNYPRPGLCNDKNISYCELVNQQINYCPNTFFIQLEIKKKSDRPSLHVTDRSFVKSMNNKV